MTTQTTPAAPSRKAYCRSCEAVVSLTKDCDHEVVCERCLWTDHVPLEEAPPEAAPDQIGEAFRAVIGCLADGVTHTEKTHALNRLATAIDSYRSPEGPAVPPSEARAHLNRILDQADEATDAALGALLGWS